MNLREKIEELIRNKQFSKAKEVAQTCDSLAEKYFYLGLVFKAELHFNQAFEMFEKSLSIDPSSSLVLWEYANLLFETGKYHESWRYLTRIPEKTWQVWERLGDAQLQLGNPAMALYYYKKASELSDTRELSSKCESLKKKHRKDQKLVIFCLPGLDSFIKEIFQVLSCLYDTKLVVSIDPKEIIEAYNWADIVWLEWANEMASEITNKLPKEQKTILCRLHGYEALSDFPKKINWSNVDHVIFVANHVLQMARKNAEALGYLPVTVIYNGVDLTKLKFKKRQKGCNLVFAGYFNNKKNPGLSIQILERLVRKDSNFKLYWIGSVDDQRIFEYTMYITEKMGIRDNFIFDGFKTDVDGYLEDKNIFLSTSIHEGYGMAILEAMAKGIKPVIHNFYIAEEFYPKEYLFNTIDEAVEMVLSDEYLSEQYRRFVEDKCPLETQIRQIVDLLSELSAERFEEKEQTSSFIEGGCVKELEKVETGDQFVSLLNRFMSTTARLADRFDFERVRVVSLKFERISDEFLSLDLILTNELRNLVSAGILVNVRTSEVIYPDYLRTSKNFDHFRALVEQLISAEIGKVSPNREIYSVVYDNHLRQQIDQNKLAYTWERYLIGTEFMPIHGLIMVAMRYSMLERFISRSDKVLEAGCGFGYGAAFLSDISQSVVGLDIDEDSIEFCSKTYPLENVEWVIGDVTQLPFDNGTFDAYVSFETLEHIPLQKVENYLTEARRVLRNGGLFILSTPNRVNRLNVHNPFHVKEYNSSELKELLGKHFRRLQFYSAEPFRLCEGVTATSTSLIVVAEK